jgi:hypothetical protein
MGLQYFYGKGQHRLLWAGSRGARVEITINVTTKYTNYCVINIKYDTIYTHTQFTNVVTGHGLETPALDCKQHHVDHN